MTLRLRVAALTDVGRVREKNEDSFLCQEADGLFVVADGMGGHLGGQMASKLAVETVSDSVGALRPSLVGTIDAASLEDSPVPRLLADAIRKACSIIYDRAQRDPELSGMGTTCTVLLVEGGCAFLAHVGDSRCYLQRGDRVIQVTDDHSLVNEQIKAGLITPEQARTSRLKNIITRSVGFERDVAVDTYALPIGPGDRLLMCSDGLANLVDDVEIGMAMATLSVDEVPSNMVSLANQRGGDDNITVICVEAQPGEKLT